MTQAEAITLLETVWNFSHGYCKKCSGNIETCPNDECAVCSVRDCPGQDLLHYHHDGCPHCCVLE